MPMYVKEEEGIYKQFPVPVIIVIFFKGRHFNNHVIINYISIFEVT